MSKSWICYRALCAQCQRNLVKITINADTSPGNGFMFSADGECNEAVSAYQAEGSETVHLSAYCSQKCKREAQD